MKHIMIDVESLGTRSDAVILSLGAVKFDLDSDKIDDKAFYASISIDSNLELGRRIQEDTLQWWLNQEITAQSVFHEEKIALPQALEDFSDWVGTGDYEVWSNGADFDIPMVAHAFAQIQMEIPWKFWAGNCVRTYKKLPGAKAIASGVPFAGVKHDALADAVHQAQVVQAIHRNLFSANKAANNPFKPKAKT